MLALNKSSRRRLSLALSLSLSLSLFLSLCRLSPFLQHLTVCSVSESEAEIKVSMNPLLAHGHPFPSPYASHSAVLAESRELACHVSRSQHLVKTQGAHDSKYEGLEPARASNDEVLGP